jgi:hypothetical protein
MATTTATRRLAAILAADVVGYSRLTSADEEGTHERVKAHLVELVDPMIREHHGRIVKTTGRTRRPSPACRRRSLYQHRPTEGCRKFRVPKIRALFEATYFAGLRKAGVPEE